MGDTHDTKHVEVLIEATDRATGPLTKLSSLADNLGAKFDRLSHGVGMLAGVGASLGAAFGFEKLIEQTGEHFGALKRITSITGMAVEQADAYAETFEKAGVDIGVTEHALTALSRQGQRMQLAM